MRVFVLLVVAALFAGCGQSEEPQPTAPTGERKSRGLVRKKIVLPDEERSPGDPPGSPNP